MKPLAATVALLLFARAFSALLVILAPGAYVAHVRNMDGAGGVALVEVYELP
jgi:hypothetical protein